MIEKGDLQADVDEDTLGDGVVDDLGQYLCRVGHRVSLQKVVKAPIATIPYPSSKGASEVSTMSPRRGRWEGNRRDLELGPNT